MHDPLGIATFFNNSIRTKPWYARTEQAMLHGSFRLATFFNIPVRVHWSFGLLILFAILSKRYFDEQNPEAYRRINTQPTLQFNTESRAGYFDLRALFQMGKLFLGKQDKTIRGHITLDSNTIRLALLMPDEAAYPLSINSKASLDSLFHGVAVRLIRQTTPQYLMQKMPHPRHHHRHIMGIAIIN